MKKAYKPIATLAEFKKFLITEDKLQAFERNLKRFRPASMQSLDSYVQHCIRMRFPSAEWVDRAFIWSKTGSQGTRVWSNVDKNWKEFIRIKQYEQLTNANTAKASV